MCPHSTALPLVELLHPGAGLCAGVCEVQRPWQMLVGGGSLET